MTGRGLRGRRNAGAIILATLAVDAFVALLFVATPNCMCPMFNEPPSLIGLPLGSVIAAVGITLHLAGLAWMVRILRADPEGHRSWWRFDRS
jgi:Flp pilus assembly protein TadB